MRNLLAFMCPLVLAAGACNPDVDLTGHGCGVAGAPQSCGATCTDDTNCGAGAYCDSTHKCNADCNAATTCPDGKVCDTRGKCVDAPMGTDGGNPFDKDGACAVLSSQATLSKSPVDVIIVVDNSGSMTDEIEAVQTNINTNFATIIGASGLDYHVILLAKFGSATSDQSICIGMPLSGNTCSPLPAKPTNTSTFFHYSQEIGSHDSWTQILSTYNKADPSGAAPMGWSQWLRPEAFKTFILITDDKYTKSGSGPNDENDFDTKLMALTPANFGTAAKRNYIWHSIISLKENTPATTPWMSTDPVQNTKCTPPPGDNSTPPDPGVSYQNLSIKTGGLRYPICQYQNFDAVFKAVAAGVVASGVVACDFDIPMPAMGTINLDNVAVQYTPGGSTTPQFFKQASTSAACVDNAFYVEAGRIHLCPTTCTALQKDPMANVQVLFTCDSTIL